MAGTGPRSWTVSHLETKHVWIAGREIGTDDTVKAQLRFTSPPTSGGVPIGLGFFHQATRASPKAPTGATSHASFAIDFQPVLDEDTKRHIQACSRASGVVQLWLPVMLYDSWRITAARTQYSLPWTVNGTSATWPTGITPFNEPVVEVRETDAVFDSTLTRVASGPSSTEYELENDDTGDSGFLTSGDLTAKDGMDLYIWAFGKIEVAVLGLEEGWVAPGEWGSILSLRFAPSPKDYEAD